MQNNVIKIEECIRYLDWKIRRKGRGIIRDEEITPLQFYALQMIKFQEGEATPTYLTNLLKLAPSTVSDMIRKMEHGGYIKKTVTEYDKRSFHIDTTEKGDKLISDVIDERRKYLDSCLAGENVDEINKIKDALTHLYEILSKE